MPSESSCPRLNALLDLVDAHQDRLHQLLVVNTKQEYSLPDDYDRFSVTTEYLSDEELNQILQGFRDGGTLTDVYVGELQFLRELVRGSLVGSDRIPLVYSTVPSGVWHGRDSLLPAICGAWSIAYCGGDPYAMGVAGNKYYALRLAERCGESTGGISLYAPEQGWCNGKRPLSGQRVIIKPALECASIGIDENSVRWVDGDLDDFLEAKAKEMNQPLLVQPFVPGYEIEVPVFGAPEPIAPSGIGIAANGIRNLGDHILTYDRVYWDEYEFYPLADERPELDSELRRSACRIFQELGMYGFARIDYRVRADGTWAVTDINAIPHLTPDASNSLAFATLGLSYPEIMKLVTGAGLRRALRRLNVEPELDVAK